MSNQFVKKILLTSAITLASVQALASPLGALYIKVGGGVNMMSKHKGKAQNYRSNPAGLAEFGVGYNLLDTVRADLTFVHYFNSKHKASTSSPHRTNKLSGNLKASINTYMINGYVDLVDVKLVKFFVGGGLGLAQVKQKYYNETVSTGNILIRKTSGSTKQANNLSYSITGGIAIAVTSIGNAELAYIYNNFGKTKSKDNGPTTRYKGSDVVARIRVNI